MKESPKKGIWKRQDVNSVIEGIWLAASILALAYLTGCASTITPDKVKDHQSSYDESTPSQYSPWNSGILYFVSNDNAETEGVVVTSNFRDRYNYLIDCYRVQFSDPEIGSGVLLEKDSGVTPYKKGTYFIDARHFPYALTLNQWQKDHRPKDSVWEKLKNL